MQGLDWTVPAAGALAGTGVFLVLALVAARLRRRGRLPATVFDAGPSVAAFLFDGEALVDATPGARQLLGLAQWGGTAWARLMQVLMPRFPDLEARLADLLDRGRIEAAATDGRSRVVAEWRGGLARLSVIEAARIDGDVPIDKLTLQAMEDELDTLRAIALRVPYLTWKEDAGGRIVWANAAYLDLADALAPPAGMPSWPPHPVFGAAAGRVSVQAVSGDERWFDLTEAPLSDGRLRAAIPADDAVHAERARLEFMQTLTKTFATLGVGLAVFDRSRRLILFNPALTELTRLPVDFLASRPLFESFAERLREARVLPEPKDFHGWKLSITRLVAEAERGTFAETWTLPGGRAYEVTGRPMPEGAIAFVVQDVSDGMRLTRQFRSEIELHQAAFDRLEAAIALFASDGTLAHANPAYLRLWPGGAETTSAALAEWRAACPDSAELVRLADHAPPAGDPIGLVFRARRRDGGWLGCRMTALPAGALLAEFTEQSGRGRSAGRPPGQTAA